MLAHCVMVKSLLTDQDLDGSHIKGLLMNLFDSFWPSLLKIDGFLSNTANTNCEGYIEV